MPKSSWLDSVRADLRGRGLRGDAYNWQHGGECRHTSSSLAFSLFGVWTSIFQCPRSPVFCSFYLYSFLLHVFSYNITPSQFRCPTHFHLPCSHCYIFFSLSFHMAYPPRSRFSCYHTYVCHTYSFSDFFLTDLVNHTSTPRKSGTKTKTKKEGCSNGTTCGTFSIHHPILS